MNLRGIFTGLLILSLVVIAVPASAFPSDYVVEPGYGFVGMPAPDLNPITFWDLSPREMAVVAALIVFPAFVIPVELFFALKIFFYLGFRRVARSNILDSSSRQAVYTSIRSDPGVRISELIRDTGLSRGSVNYHLAMLAFTGKITLLRTHGDISYFENSGKYTPAEQKVLKYLRSETERQILAALFTAARTSRSDLEKVLALSGPTVTWHMKRLSDDGIVSIAKDGRFSSYSLQEGIGEFVGKHLNTTPSFTPAGSGISPHEVTAPAAKA